MVSSPAVSKRSLLFAHVRLLKVLKFEALQNELNFPDPHGYIEYITHINNVLEDLSSFQAKIKEGVETEKNEKDKINREANNERFNR